MSTLSLRKIKHDSSAVDNITLDSSGQVGMGTSTPTARLEVQHTQTAMIRATQTGTDGWDAILSLKNTHTGGKDWRLLSTNDSRGIIGGGKFVIQNYDNGSNTQYLTIDSSGRVTMPYQPAFRVKINNSNYVSSTNSIMPFSVAEVNVGGHFNTSTYRFTAPINGTYMLYVVVYTRVDNAQDAYPRIRVNGTNKAYSYNCHVSGITGRQDLTNVLPYMATLNAGDYVEVFFQGNGYSYNGSEETCFSGYLVN